MRQRVFKDVKNIPPKVRRRKMLEGHVAMLIDVIKKRPYLFIDEIARELKDLCHVQYLPSQCYRELRRSK